MSLTEKKGLGWIPDLPDIRDYNPEHKSISSFFEKNNLIGVQSNVPSSIIIPDCDFSPIEDQQSIGSCTANAAIGLVEYYQKKTKGKYLDMSRLFLYKATRNLLGWTGDTGAYLRSAMGALVLFGSPPEEYWPYDISKYDIEPPAFLYAFAKEFQTVRYFRLDPPRVSKEDLLKRIKSFINRKMPIMFGFTVYNSISQASSTGEIPYPCEIDRRSGGHAVIATGFDDNKKIENRVCGKSTTGAIRIRNSWGTDWGNEGYGWIPYEYVLNGLAIDWWSLIRNEWTDLDVFRQ